MANGDLRNKRNGLVDHRGGRAFGVKDSRQHKDNRPPKKQKQSPGKGHIRIGPRGIGTPATHWSAEIPGPCERVGLERPAVAAQRWELEAVNRQRV